MRVFVTGATGFIGSAVVADLLAAGHRVLGLTRSEAGAAALAAAGAEIHRGSLEDLDGLRSGAAAADAVIHLAFNHDFTRYQQSCAEDGRVVRALGAGLAGSARPLIVTSGTAAADSPPGRAATEEDPAVGSTVMPRAASEEAAAALLAEGVNVSVVRLPQVHDTVRQGLVTVLIAAFRERGACVYIGEGRNRWPACPVADAARLYRLAVERAEAGARYHPVAEEGVPLRAVAEAVGRRLGLPARSITPEEAPAFFGWVAMFAGADIPAASALTRDRLGWQPSGPGLIADLDRLAVTAA
ncbi:SDR family oxidoreductase [Methylobacterium sp. JK268]